MQENQVYNLNVVAQDVLATPAQREAWIDLLARRLTPLIDDPALRRPFWSLLKIAMRE